MYKGFDLGKAIRSHGWAYLVPGLFLVGFPLFALFMILFAGATVEGSPVQLALVMGIMASIGIAHLFISRPRLLFPLHSDYARKLKRRFDPENQYTHKEAMEVLQQDLDGGIPFAYGCVAGRQYLLLLPDVVKLAEIVDIRTVRELHSRRNRIYAAVDCADGRCVQHQMAPRRIEELRQLVFGTTPKPADASQHTGEQRPAFSPPVLQDGATGLSALEALLQTDRPAAVPNPISQNGGPADPSNTTAAYAGRHDAYKGSTTGDQVPFQGFSLDLHLPVQQIPEAPDTEAMFQSMLQTARLDKAPGPQAETGAAGPEGSFGQKGAGAAELSRFAGGVQAGDAVADGRLPPLDSSQAYYQSSMTPTRFAAASQPARAVLQQAQPAASPPNSNAPRTSSRLGNPDLPRFDLSLPAKKEPPPRPVIPQRPSALAGQPYETPSALPNLAVSTTDTPVIPPGYTRSVTGSLSLREVEHAADQAKGKEGRNVWREPIPVEYKASANRLQVAPLNIASYAARRRRQMNIFGAVFTFFTAVLSFALFFAGSARSVGAPLAFLYVFFALWCAFYFYLVAEWVLALVSPQNTWAGRHAQKILREDVGSLPAADLFAQLQADLDRGRTFGPTAAMGTRYLFLDGRITRLADLRRLSFFEPSTSEGPPQTLVIGESDTGRKLFRVPIPTQDAIWMGEYIKAAYPAIECEMNASLYDVM